MKVNSWMLYGAVSLLSATMIEAQEPRGRTGLGRAYSLGDIVTIAGDAAVQKELGLSPETAAKVNAAQDAFVETVRDKLPPGSIRYRIGVMDNGGIRNVQGTTFEAREVFKAAVDKYLLELKDTLTGDQYTRLQQIHWQVMGTSAFSEADVIETMMITKEQQESIGSIKDDYNAKRQELLGGGPRSLRMNAELREKLAELNKEEDLRIHEKLTESQLDQFAMMKGKEFDAPNLRDEHGGLGGRGGRSLLRPRGNGGLNASILLTESRQKSIFDLIENEAVKTELAIGADDATKLRKLATEFRVVARETNSDTPNLQGKPVAEMCQGALQIAKVENAVAEKLLPKVKLILTADQFTRLKQIHWQILGATAFSKPDVIEALSITKAQQDQIMAIWAEHEEKQLGLFTRSSGEPGPAMRQKNRELNNERDAKLVGVLTEGQRERFASLKGSKFDVSQILERSSVQLLGADPDFDVSIAHPAYTDRHPAVLFDEAHQNFHTSSRRYKAFADLMTNDGYQVSPGREKFTPDLLARYEILVIANAPAVSGSSKSAFSEDECDAIHHWVKTGGSLLLVTDHEPFGSGSRELAHRFGVNMSTRATRDPANETERGLLFSREKNQIGEHPIMTGRDNSEMVNRVLTFTGQSLAGPPGSVELLRFAETAQEEEAGATVSAAGRAQAVALKIDRGRVVVMGEAAQLSAQVTGFPPRPMGMNAPGCDNRKMAINLIHWLSGLLD